jgi:hypothetical protein
MGRSSAFRESGHGSGLIRFGGQLSKVSNLKLLFAPSRALREIMPYIPPETDTAELHRTTGVLRVSSAGVRESHVHDVIIAKEASNCPRRPHGHV